MGRFISQNELQNSSAEILNAVEAGETFVVTCNGEPVAELGPMHRHRYVPISEVLENFPDSPKMDYQEFRADLDRLLPPVLRVDLRHVVIIKVVIHPRTELESRTRINCISSTTSFSRLWMGWPW